jgi:importin-5
MLIISLQHYSSIMPLLLNVLRNADGPGYRKLRVKAMECAGLIGADFPSCTNFQQSQLIPMSAIAVGHDVFRPDANTFVELLMQIQSASFMFKMTH